MKFMLVAFAALSLAVVNVNGLADWDDFLERGLEKALYPQGALDVDVDDFDYQPGVYRVSITTGTLWSDSESKLKTALHGLGFTDARIETVSLGVKIGFYGSGFRDTFIVHFNLATFKNVLPTAGGVYHRFSDEDFD